MDDLVSIILPVYDCGRYLGECIESVLSQSLTAWELLIVDDASRDDSHEIARRHAGEDDRIRCLRHETGDGHPERPARLAVLQRLHHDLSRRHINLLGWKMDINYRPLASILALIVQTISAQFL